MNYHLMLIKNKYGQEEFGKFVRERYRIQIKSDFDILEENIGWW
jgi:hypothetical protein